MDVIPEFVSKVDDLSKQLVVGIPTFNNGIVIWDATEAVVEINTLDYILYKKPTCTPCRDSSSYSSKNYASQEQTLIPRLASPPKSVSQKRSATANLASSVLGSSPQSLIPFPSESMRIPQQKGPPTKTASCCNTTTGGNGSWSEMGSL